MSDYGHPQYTSSQYQAPKPKKTARNILIGVGVVIVAMVGLGAALSPSPAKAPVSVTSKAGSATITPPPVTKTVTPLACTTALDAADEIIASAGDGFAIMAEAMTAAGNFDAAGIDAATVKLTALNKDQLTPQLAAYRAVRDACSGS
jgi:hypothetical protein